MKAQRKHPQDVRSSSPFRNQSIYEWMQEVSHSRCHDALAIPTRCEHTREVSIYSVESAFVFFYLAGLFIDSYYSTLKLRWMTMRQRMRMYRPTCCTAMAMQMLVSDSVMCCTLSCMRAISTITTIENEKKATHRIGCLPFRSLCLCFAVNFIVSVVSLTILDCMLWPQQQWKSLVKFN